MTKAERERGDVLIGSDGTVRLVLGDGTSLFIMPDGGLPIRGEQIPTVRGRTWTLLKGGSVRDRLVAAIARAQDPSLGWPA